MKGFLVDSCVCTRNKRVSKPVCGACAKKLRVKTQLGLNHRVRARVLRPAVIRSSAPRHIPNTVYTRFDPITATFTWRNVVWL